MEHQIITQAQFLEALRLLAEPSWTDVAGVVVGFLQVGLIAWGLWLMHKASDTRNRQLDQQDEALRRQGEVLAELLRRSA